MNTLENRFKEEATAIDWIMIGIYVLWIVAIHSNLVLINNRLFITFIIPNALYLAALCFMIWKRAGQKKRTLVKAYLFALCSTMVFLLLSFALYYQSINLPL